MKGTIRSLKAVLNIENITIAFITEAQLKRREQITIKRYRWVQRQGPNKKGGGVGILVSEKNAQNTTEDKGSDEHEHLKTKFIKLECRPKYSNQSILWTQESKKEQRK